MSFIEGELVPGKKLEKPIVPTFYITTDDSKIYHYGEVKTNNVTETGQPYMKKFSSKEEMIKMLPQEIVDEEVKTEKTK